METDIAECRQIKKYGGFYIGRYEAGVSTYNEATGNFQDSVTFSNNASLFDSVPIEIGLYNSKWQNYSFTARQKNTIVSIGSNKTTGNIVEKANSIPYFHADYYTAIEMCRKMYENNSTVQSGLVTGTRMGYDHEIFE